MLEVELRFGTLFTLAIEHNYLSNRLGGNFSLKPSNHTLHLMKKLGLHYKNSAQAMVFSHHEMDAFEYLVRRHASLKFSFWLYQNDLHFINYTSLLPKNISKDIVYLSNSYSENQGSLLHARDFVANEDCLPVFYGQVPFPIQKKANKVQLLDEYGGIVHTQELEAEQNFSYRDRNLTEGMYTLVANGERKSFLFFHENLVPKPLAWVEINWSEKMLDNILGQINKNKKNEPYNFMVSFEERKTVWRYIIIPKYENPSNLEVRMIEGQDKVTFSKPVEGKFYNQQAYIFESNQLLSMKERPNCSFELVSGSKIIKKLLPAPSPELIKPSSDNLKFYSEIIVYI
ncbi:hypothetical protein [Microscilla marina]|uniref:Uncharacterized protein n=1 Tax=Microscilla marina ATCC 23134 TaxID=313606 RepID=A1ZX13_MICM2|nr:hypothetical protein [Microscilla marina]EAY25093.1 hypothetical protein M23134_06081 [Microscilla marina ATCC 23134]